MTIFCDTNIVMEYLQQRPFASQVEAVLEHTVQNGDELYISVGSFYTITYLTERYLKTNHGLAKADRLMQLRYILNGVLNTFKLANTFSKSINDGVNDLLFDDLEDGYQAHVASDLCCDILLTINEKHFNNFKQQASIKVMTPADFVDKYC